MPPDTDASYMCFDEILAVLADVGHAIMLPPEGQPVYALGKASPVMHVT
jgi:hypothetical protein